MTVRLLTLFVILTGVGQAANTLTIVRGQGQVVREQFRIIDPFTIQIKDDLGNLRLGETVTFAVTSGMGTFNTFDSQGSPLPNVTCSNNVCTATTGADGRAAVSFLATSVASGNSYSQQTITTTYGAQTQKFYLTTVLSSLSSGGSASPPIVERLAPVDRNIIGPAGGIVKGAIQFRVIVVSGPQSGQFIPNVGIYATTGNLPTEGPVAECVGNFMTDATGVGSCDLQLGTFMGVAPLSVNVGGYTSLGGNSLNVDVRSRPPVISGTLPITSEGAQGTFTFNLSHPDGLSKLGVVNLLVNSALTGANACYIAYSVPQATLYLVNDQGPDSGLSAGMTLGGSASVSNGQCRVFSSGSSAAMTGGVLVLALRIEFGSAFSGGKVVYLAARTTDESSTGWRTSGIHTVPGVSVRFPNSFTNAPVKGTTATSQITFSYMDALSSTNLETAWGLTGTALDARQACYFAYYAPGNLLFLYPDNGDGAQATSIVLAPGNVIENSQCRISGTGSSVSRNGGSLLVTLNTTYKSAFAGPRVIWTAVSTLGGGASPWKPTGAWQVPP